MSKGSDPQDKAIEFTACSTDRTGLTRKSRAAHPSPTLGKTLIDYGSGGGVAQRAVSIVRPSVKGVLEYPQDCGPIMAHARKFLDEGARHLAQLFDVSWRRVRIVRIWHHFLLSCADGLHGTTPQFATFRAPNSSEAAGVCLQPLENPQCQQAG